MKKKEEKKRHWGKYPSYCQMPVLGIYVKWWLL